jgi:hypothetical protein
MVARGAAGADLDQTVIGNPSHDLIRPAVSLATASRGQPAGRGGSQMIEAMIVSYGKRCGRRNDLGDMPRTIGLAVSPDAEPGISLQNNASEKAGRELRDCSSVTRAAQAVRENY